MTDVIVSKQGGVLELRLDRPAKKNALNFAMYRALTGALEDAERDDSIRAVVFTSNGETFCAGNDVTDFMSGNADGGPPPAIAFVQKIATFTKPMVAAVHGAAVGVGATMLLHCDLVYGSETARLSMPFVNLGLVPEAGSSLLLPRRVGHAVAAEMILLATPIDAKRAKELGLFNDVIEVSALAAHALGKAAELAQKPPTALRLSRALLRGNVDEVSARIVEEGVQFATCLAGDEAREAFMAFMQRKG